MPTHRINGLVIETEYWAKPIPINRFDWSAITENYESGDPIGYGKTEADAIKDLTAQIEENEG